MQVKLVFRHNNSFFLYCFVLLSQQGDDQPGGQVAEKKKGDTTPTGQSVDTVVCCLFVCVSGIPQTNSVVPPCCWKIVIFNIMGGEEVSGRWLVRANLGSWGGEGRVVQPGLGLQEHCMTCARHASGCFCGLGPLGGCSTPGFCRFWAVVSLVLWSIPKSLRGVFRVSFNLFL